MPEIGHTLSSVLSDRNQHPVQRRKIQVRSACSHCVNKIPPTMARPKQCPSLDDTGKTELEAAGLFVALYSRYLWAEPSKIFFILHFIVLGLSTKADLFLFVCFPLLVFFFLPMNRYVTFCLYKVLFKANQVVFLTSTHDRIRSPRLLPKLF